MGAAQPRGFINNVDQAVGRRTCAGYCGRRHRKSSRFHAPRPYSIMRPSVGEHASDPLVSRFFQTIEKRGRNPQTARSFGASGNAALWPRSKLERGCWRSPSEARNGILSLRQELESNVTLALKWINIRWWRHEMATALVADARIRGISLFATVSSLKCLNLHPDVSS